jgi:hypothetical protein
VIAVVAEVFSQCYLEREEGKKKETGGGELFLKSTEALRVRVSTFQSHLTCLKWNSLVERGFLVAREIQI